MKKFLLLTTAALLAMAQTVQAQTDLIVAFDVVRSSNGTDPTNYVVQDGVDIVTTRSGTDDAGAAKTPGVNAAGSTDGTIGSVVVAGVSTATTASTESWRWTNGAQTATFDFAVTDTSGADRTMTTFHFDGGTNRPNVAQDFELFLVEGAVETSLATGTIPLESGGADPEYTNFDLVMGSGVALNANSTVNLSLRFTRDDASGNVSGHHGYLDNVGIGTGQVATVLLGDVDLSGEVNFLDISPFISALSGGQYQAEADCDESGEVDFLDISPFIAILSGS